MIPAIAMGLFELGKSFIKSKFPDPVEQAAEILKLEELAQKGDLAKLNAHVSLLQGQMNITMEEAKHPSVFVAGWRPFVGWVCGCSLLYVGLLEPFLRFWATMFGFEGEFPEIDTTTMIPVLLGMLGISHHRSEDKKNGTGTERTGK